MNIEQQLNDILIKEGVVSKDKCSESETQLYNELKNQGKQLPNNIVFDNLEKEYIFYIRTPIEQGASNEEWSEKDFYINPCTDEETQKYRKKLRNGIDLPDNITYTVINNCYKVSTTQKDYEYFKLIEIYKQEQHLSTIKKILIFFTTIFIISFFTLIIFGLQIQNLISTFM